jgi:hypothetical protein
MECWVDAAYASEWNIKTASTDQSTARSRMGYIIAQSRMPHALDIKDANWNSFICYRDRIHSTFTGHEGEVTNRMANGRSKATRYTSTKCNTLDILQSLCEDKSGAIEIAMYPKWDQGLNISTSSTITLEKR